jgi:putative membrane protein
MMWDDGDGHWQRMHDGSGAGWLMLLLMLVVVVAVVVAVVALLRGSTSLNSAPRPALGATPDPRAILQERFARGEIDEQDYRARVRALDETVRAPG